MQLMSGARSRLLGLGVAVAAVVAAPATARADEVFFAGSTGGAFNGAAPGNSASLLGLTFASSTFSGTTSNGFLGIGNNATPPANVNNLGSFALSSASNVYNNNSFSLLVTFTAPASITGGQSSSYTATLFGSVSSDNNGGVLVDFDNTPRTFTFSNGQANGSFSFAVNDVSINAGKTTAITGQIMSATQTTVPEPGSMALLGSGLASMGAMIRRRKTKTA